MPHVLDVEWDLLGDVFGDCALTLRDSLTVGGSYRIAEFSRRTGSSVDSVEGLLEAVAEDGLLARTQIWVCQQSDDVIDEPDPADTECPECGQPFQGQRPIAEVQYTVVAPPRRSVPAVVAIHGMNTRGAWQERLGFLLSGMYGRSIPLAVHKYGLIITGVILRWRQRQLTKRFVSQLKLVSADLGDRPFGNRPDVIAHSFGTWLLYHALLEDESLRVGHVILAGCILPPNTRWSQFGDRVGPVLNIYGGKDPWTRVAAYIIPDSGPAGRRGFEAQPGLVQVFKPEFGHSTCLEEENIDEIYAEVFAPFLSTPASDLDLLDPEVFAPTHNPRPWKPVPRLFHAGIARWVTLMMLALAIPLLVAAAVPLAAGALAVAAVAGFGLAAVAVVGKLRGWDT